MTIVNFQEISFSATKVGKCPKCGKRAQRTEKFWQTINPFNKMPDGRIKNDMDIRRELTAEMNKWENEPVYHMKCE